MKIKSLEIHNILSIEDAKIEFEDQGMVLVEGWNYDDDTANGAGKTSIFNALSFAIYGKAPRKISASEFLRDGSKTGFARVEISCAIYTFSVVRSRPNRTEFFRDGILLDITQEEFEKEIGLNYNQFLVAMYNAQVEGKNFLYLNDSSKKEFLLQLLNLEEFSDAKKLADDKVKTAQKQIDEIASTITSLQGKIAAYSDSLEDAQALQQAIDDNVSQLISLNQEAAAMTKVEAPDTSKYTDLEKKLRTKRQQVSDAKAKLSLATRQRQNHERDILLLERDTSIAPDADCPHCDKPLIISGKLLQKADSIESKKTAIEHKIMVIKTDIALLDEDIASMRREISKEIELDNIEAKINQQKASDMAEYNASIRALSTLQSQISSLQSTNNHLSKQLIKSQDSLEKIHQLKTTELELIAQIEKLSTEQAFLKAASALFAPTGASAYIMDSIVDAFNEAVEEYVTVIWPNAKYRLLSYKESSSGSTVAKFSEELIINGKDKSIGSLSGGEQRCLSLAVDFAIIDVLSNRYSIAINPMVMDEPFTGLDSSNRERVIDLIEKLAVDRQIWIIDHCNESKAMFSKVIRVEKRNGSSIIS